MKYRTFSLLVLLLFSINLVTASLNGTDQDVPIETLVNLTGNNDLWTSLLRNCENPSLSCVRDTVYNYFKEQIFNSSDVEFTSFLKFTKNNIDYKEINPIVPSNQLEESKNETEDDYDSPIQQMSRSLHDDTLKFLMTHDLEVPLPGGIVEDGVLKVSPRSFEGGGTLVKLEVVPKVMKNDVGEGRIFFKKIKKFIDEKLIYALLAILLVIKLLAVKFLFVLPLIVGAATAKKLLLKILLFVFPALHHLFKFCAYYPIQAKYHHHKHLISHIHQVAPQPHHHFDHHEGPPAGEYAGPEYAGPPGGYHDHPVGYHEEDAFNLGDGVVYDSHGSGFPNERPWLLLLKDIIVNMIKLGAYGSSSVVRGFIGNVISHRHDPTYNEIEPSYRPAGISKRPSKKKPLTSSDIERMIAKAEREAAIKARLQKERLRIREENLRLQEQLNHALKLQEKLKHQAGKLSPAVRLNAALTPPVPSNSVSSYGPPFGPNVSPPRGSVKTGAGQFDPTFNGIQQQNALPHAQPASSAQNPADAFIEETNLKTVFIPQHVPQAATSFQNTQFKTSHEELDPRHPVYTPPDLSQTSAAKQSSKTNQQKPKLDEEIYQAASITYDPFYTPILEKVDKILNDLGFEEEPCKERLICSMYKNPQKFSPHSNLISTEISRDANELQKPTSTNAAVVRFYKYIQAARDGQDGRDCLRLYPTCAINTDL